MKKILLLLLFFGLNAFSQQFIQKKDGTKITVADGSIRNEPRNKRLGYLLKDDLKEYHVSYKDLDFALYTDFLFKTFLVKKKPKGYFVLAEANGKTLVTFKQTKIKSRGGFESTYTHYEIGVLDSASNFVESLTFSDENSNSQIEERGKIIPMIKSQFPDCQKLLEKISLFESPPSDTKNTTILVFLNDPIFVKCN